MELGAVVVDGGMILPTHTIYIYEPRLCHERRRGSLLGGAAAGA